MAGGKAEIKGLRETQEKLKQVVRDLQGSPFLRAISRATLIVQADAKRKVPVDTGRLRSSIWPEVRTGGMTVRGIVGSVVRYAPYVELGTKRMAARPYLQPALDNNKDKIVKILGDAVGEIVRQ